MSNKVEQLRDKKIKKDDRVMKSNKRERILSMNNSDFLQPHLTAKDRKRLQERTRLAEMTKSLVKTSFDDFNGIRDLHIKKSTKKYPSKSHKSRKLQDSKKDEKKEEKKDEKKKDAKKDEKKKDSKEDDDDKSDEDKLEEKEKLEKKQKENIEKEEKKS